MEARAMVKYARISPRKVQIVLDLIRNKPVDVAVAIVHNTPKAACEYLEKLLKSAAANAENKNMDVNNLYVSFSREAVREPRVARSASIREPATSPLCSRKKSN